MKLILPCYSSFRKDQGTVLMLVVVSAFIMSIVGLGSINLMGMQEIQARNELNVLRCQHLADAGLELARVWLSEKCMSNYNYIFPEHLGEEFQTTFPVAEKHFEDGGSILASITPADNVGHGVYLTDFTMALSSGGYYVVSATGTVNTGGHSVSVNKLMVLYLRKVDGEYGKFVARTPLPNVDGNAGLLARGHGTATLLDNGRILIAGGDSGSIKDMENGDRPLRSALEYDPVSDAYQQVGNMSMPREHHTATRVFDKALGRFVVLIAGGDCGPGTPKSDGSNLTKTMELYDPGSKTFIPIDPLSANLGNVRACHNAIALRPMPGSDDAALITGGRIDWTPGNVWDDAMVYQTTRKIVPVPAVMSSPKDCHYTSTLNDGKILIYGGGTGGDGPSETVEVYDPVVRTLKKVADNHGKDHGSLTMLRDGNALAVGGTSPVVELFKTSNAIQKVCNFDRVNHYTALLPTGQVLIAGGHTSDDKPVLAAKIYSPGKSTLSNGPSCMTFRCAESNNNEPIPLRNGNLLFIGGWSGSVESSNAISAVEMFYLPIVIERKENSYVENPVVVTAL